MLIFLICLMFLGIYKMKIVHNKKFMNKDQCQSIKGFFIIVVFLSHIKGYLDINTSTLDGRLFLLFFNILGQLMVSMFLFYSGYGVAESFEKKKGYKESFLKKRVLKTVLNFDLMICAYLILNHVLGIEYPLNNYVFCWLGWESIGNSNWYIFDILILYIITYISYRYVRSEMLNTILIIALTVLVIIFLKYTKVDGWWYNTLLCYPTGVLFSKYKEIIYSIIDKYYFLSLCFLCIVFLVTYIWGQSVEIIYLISASLFCLVVCVMMRKIEFGNKVLLYFGDNLFYIYVLQRLPMILFNHLRLNELCGNVIFTVITLICTLTISYIFNYITNKINYLLLKNV